MIYQLLAIVSNFAIQTISALNYFGVIFLMALESACIPIPSEVIMPFSGFLVFEGKFSFWLVVFWGTMGNLIGSAIAYFIGFYGGRPLVEKYGKYILLSHSDLELAERWFQKYGSLSIFFSRILPVARTFISFPAGVAKMNFFKFSVYTTVGSAIWSVFLTYVGFFGGENWSKIEVYFKKFDWFIGILGILGIGWFIYHKLKLKNLKT
ncbi:MAG: alkaline phosphatase [Candidatus Nealsonbacteria bacterium CG_4_10_14_0_2_um_filter_38_17]|uniref:Alkaline phosphatase n=2 Tax=Candidatus Nealsoniibacteriota TaxID=1817911 RepID=A0A2M7UZ00_9BACT|nr:MAG: alkaline phosphatase [Candidatus Nealsonbacteria bacterium CG23_combo_of_CG06-09_8_20_14_all_38_19]PIZ89170.1 MAG: alkaline phosphatase [Candidatus Nealsonbacteria bacterium CG_4_10_14_0_2_um_filter_38_17]